MPKTLDKVAAKLLADESLPERAPTRAERAATIDAIRGALADRRRARARRRWMIPLAATAACAAAGVALWISSRDPGTPAAVAPAAPSASVPSFALAHPSGDATFVVSGGARTSISGPTTLAPRDAVLTGDGTVGVYLATGTRLDVERESEALLPDGSADQLVELRRGAVIAHVAKLRTGERFVIRTADAEVEVRGTVFRVARIETGRCGTATRVEVTEGRVVVREHGEEHVLGAGDRWQRACDEPAPAPAPAPTTSHVAPAPAPVKSSPPAASELAAQNALFADAMTAKRRGDARAAVASLDDLVEHHPRSPLREAAEAERMKLLATSDPARAAAAARAYLARYPNGFAVPDANAILAR